MILAVARLASLENDWKYKTVTPGCGPQTGLAAGLISCRPSGTAKVGSASGNGYGNN